MAKKTNARTEGSRRLAVTPNKTTATVLVVGAVLVAAVWFGYTSPVRQSSGERRIEVEQVDAQISVLNSEAKRWRDGDPELVALVDSVRSVESVVPKDSPNGEGTQAALKDAVESSAAASGAEVLADTSYAPAAEVPGVPELRKVTATVVLDASLEASADTVDRIRATPGLLVGVEEVAASSATSRFVIVAYFSSAKSLLPG